MAYMIGLNVVEVDGRGSPAIVGAAASVGGFNILTRRGVPNTPIRVTNFTQFVERFGSFFAGGLGAYMVKGFFDNGGQTAWINRVVDTNPATGHATASLSLLDGAAHGTLSLEAGYRGEDDPGVWGNDLFVKVTPASGYTSRILETARATVQGTPLAATVDLSALTALQVKIDGEATASSIAFAASDFANAAAATRAEIRDAINRKTSKLVASLSVDDRLVLTSAGETATLSGGWSSVQVTVAYAALGLSLMGSPAYGTAAGITAGGTRLAKTDGFKVGDAMRISDGTISAFAKILSIDTLTGAVTWTPAIGTPGSYDAKATTVAAVEFDLAIAVGTGDDEHLVENWKGLSMEPDLTNYAPTIINDTIRGSKYVTATDQNSVSPSGADIPAALAYTKFNPGRDGTPGASAFAGDQSARTGLYTFDPIDIQLLTCERTDQAIVNQALGYCANRGDCMYVGAVPEGYVAANQAVNYGKAFQGKKVYGALYGPWIKVLDPISTSASPYKFINPAGHCMGVFARTETVRGIWKAPAGDEAVISGALDVEQRLSDADHTDLVKSGSVNGIRAIPGAGIIIDASRTLSTDTRWLYVNVRLLFNYVKSSLKLGLRWVRQEPNRDMLWSSVKYNSVVPFLMGLWRQGAFGTGNPDDVFTVICDSSNNPPAEVEQGNFRLEVYFYPTRPAETIIITVGQQPAGGSASEG
jgi:hypothetical protein